jgi:Ca2+-binding EF-hand superfamily protein
MNQPQAIYSGIRTERSSIVLCPVPVMPLAALFLILAWQPQFAAAQGNKPDNKAFAGGGFDRDEKPPADLKDLVDADGDGTVSDAEARLAAAELQKLKPKTDEARAIIKALDKNENKKIDPDEAYTAVAQTRLQTDEMAQNVDRIFQELDTDDDNYVSAAEFGKISEQLGPLGQVVGAGAAQIFKAIDSNRDGGLSMVEAQFAADSLGRQMALRRKQDEANRNSKLWQIAQQTLASMDKNRDKRITLREASGKVEENFAQIDADLDGKLTVAELFKYLQEHQGENAGK